MGEEGGNGLANGEGHGFAEQEEVRGWKESGVEQKAEKKVLSRC